MPNNIPKNLLSIATAPGRMAANVIGLGIAAAQDVLRNHNKLIADMLIYGSIGAALSEIVENFANAINGNKIKPTPQRELLLFANDSRGNTPVLSRKRGSRYMAKIRKSKGPAFPKIEVGGTGRG